MSHNPIGDVVSLLNSDAGLGLTVGTDLFVGNMRGPNSKIPVNAVFVAPGSADVPTRVMGEVNEIRQVLALIRIRWKTFGAGDAKARAIQNALQAASLPGPSVYLDFFSTESLPTSLGQDGEGHHLWTTIFTVVYEEIA